MIHYNVITTLSRTQECIKPVKFEANKSKTGSKITIQDDGSYMQATSVSITCGAFDPLGPNKPVFFQSGLQKLEKVEITLADCLACSGCITSAEGVLITQQSQEELLKVMNENNLAKLNNQLDSVRYIVFTVAQQPILSLAKRYNLGPEETFERVAGKIRVISLRNQPND